MASMHFLPGIFFGFAAFGPGIGYIVGGVFLNTYVDVDRIGTNRYAAIMYVYHSHIHIPMYRLKRH